MPLPEETGTVLLAGVVGSTAYGLAGPNSDIDRLGMYAAPTTALLRLTPPAESHVTSAPLPDSTFHEAGKAARLGLSCNPTASELLWLPDDLYEVRTPLGDEAIAIRKAFLSAPRVRNAYLGYATQQFRKLLSRNEGDGERDGEREGEGDNTSATRNRTAKHARHLMRLADQGLELYRTGELTIRLPDPDRYRTFGEKVAEDPEAARPFMAEAEERFATARSVLPDEPDVGAVEAWLLRVRREFWDANEPARTAPLDTAGGLSPFTDL